MEKKKEFVTIINYAKYVAFVLSTIFVMVFQFTGTYLLINIALALYVVAFGLMFTSLVIHCVEIYKADRIAKSDKAKIISPSDTIDGVVVAKSGELNGEQVEVVNLTKEKIMSVIGAIFFGGFTIFTFVVLILI